MNFYPHHLGDYAKDTKHLSVTEHGAYRLLMDHYYSTESPLPDNFPALYRICGASNKIEKSAVETVIKCFFELRGGCYHQKRIDLELLDYDERVAVNRLNGKKGGRPPKQKPIRFPVGFDSDTQDETKDEPNQNPIHNPESNNHHPTPETKNQKPWKPTPLQQRINRWFKRRDATPWSEKEIKAYRMVADASEEDLASLERRYLSDAPYKRQDVLTLLNNWPGEIDRANKPPPKQAPGAEEGIFLDWGKDTERRAAHE